MSCARGAISASAGWRRLSTRFPHRDEVEVVWRAFELDPAAPRRRILSAADHLAEKYGMTGEQVAASWKRLTALAEEDGLEYHLDRTAGGSSFDAHRLIRLGKERGLQDKTKERLLRAYFTEGLPIAEPEVLARLGVEVGLPASEVDELLATNLFADSVREDERQAQRHGIQGVPFFAIDDRYGVSGAQSPELLLESLSAGWRDRMAAASS